MRIWSFNSVSPDDDSLRPKDQLQNVVSYFSVTREAAIAALEEDARLEWERWQEENEDEDAPMPELKWYTASGENVMKAEIIAWEDNATATIEAPDGSYTMWYYLFQAMLEGLPE